MRAKHWVVALAVVWVGLGAAGAQTTRQWRQTKAEEFARGEANGVAVNSRGWLELAPKIETLFAPNVAHLWSGALDAHGDLWVVGGSPARLFRVTAKGSLSEIALPRELDAQAVAIGPDGAPYVALQPGGKIYKVAKGAPEPSAKSEAAKSQDGEAKAEEARAPIDAEHHLGPLFYAAPASTIWALSFDAQGRLYVATGDRGSIYRVDKSGHGELFFHCAQPNIRSLAWDGKGNLLAGTDGGGRLYSIAPDGRGFVLHVGDKPELTAIVVARDGAIYAAAAGERKASGKAAQKQMKAAAAMMAEAAANAPQAPPVNEAAALAAVAPSTLGGSTLVRIDAEGARVLWSSREEVVYSLALAPDGRLLAACGNKGKLLAIDEEGESSELGRAPVAQLTSLIADGRGGFYALGGNSGQIARVDFAARQGSFESEVFDARVNSRWGRFELESRGAVELMSRSGNVETPGEGWSDWAPVEASGQWRDLSPSARFAQYKVVLKAGAEAPRVEAVTLNYLPAHQRPQLGEVEVFVNSRMPQARMIGEGAHAEASAPQPTHEQGHVALRWGARGEAERLSYSVELRGEGESRWLTLRKGLASNFFSFDSTLLPDGAYRFRVTASDAPVYAPGEAMTVSRESQTATIDNTPPAIVGLRAVIAGGKIRLTMKANDALSTIERAECSIDGGLWTPLPPVGELSDAREESYDAAFVLKSEGEAHVVAVRVYDRAGNMAVARAQATEAK